MSVRIDAQPGGQPDAPNHGFHLASAGAARGLPYSLGGTGISRTPALFRYGDIHARGFMSLWRGTPDAPVHAHRRHQVQLLAMPAHWWTMGVLRVRHRQDFRPSGVNS